MTDINHSPFDDVRKEEDLRRTLYPSGNCSRRYKLPFNKDYDALPDDEELEDEESID